MNGTCLVWIHLSPYQGRGYFSGEGYVGVLVVPTEKLFERCRRGRPRRMDQTLRYALFDSCGAFLLRSFLYTSAERRLRSRR